MRTALSVVSLVALIASLLAMPGTALAAPVERYRILVFTNGAPAHATKAVRVIRDLGKANGFGVQSNADPELFTATQLARFRAVVFLDTTGSPLNAGQQEAFEA